MTSIVCPGAICSLAHVENTPPGAFFTATRSVPSWTAEQIEYERRMSSAPMFVRKVRCWPGSKRKVSRSEGGTSKVSAIASRVSRATEAIVKGWNLLTAGGVSCCARSRASMRLEVVEWLETFFAAMLRLARRRAEPRQLAGPQRAAARTRHRRRLAAAQTAYIYRLHGGARPRRRDPVFGQSSFRRRRDPVGRPGRRQACLDSCTGDAGVRQRRGDVGGD